MKERSRKVAFTLCLLVFLAAVGYIGYYYVTKEQNTNIYEKLQKEQNPTGKRFSLKKPGAVIPIDFEELKKTNADIYAWIHVPDTNINYPIVQSPTDDAYYLDHTIEGKAGYPGSIYTEKVNAKDFSDFNTVIYGHDMKDGSMFKDLHKYEDSEFFDKHSKITIYTETEHKTYEVFAAVVYNDNHIMYTYDNENVEDRKAFLRSIYESRDMKNQIRTDVPVDENSHIITLSTCIGGHPDKRFIVGAVEVDE